MARAFEMLGPGTDVRVLDGAALLVAVANDVLAGRVNAGLRAHAADDGDFVRIFGEVLHDAAEFKAGLRADGLLRSLGGAFLGVQGVDVTHAAGHLEEDDVFGLAEAGASRCRSGFGGFFCREGSAAEAVQNGDAERGAGPAFAEGTAGNGIELVLNVHDGCWLAAGSIPQRRIRGR